jgi:diguanylate cyclase (GGDEF)-like protein
MLTQDTITVLLIALVVNAIVVASLIVAPRLRDWSRRRSVAGPAANGGSASVHPSSPGSDAGQPWFLTAANNGTSGRDHGPVEAMTTPVPPMASPSSWASWLDEEFARAARYHRPVTIVLVELAGLDRLADRVGRAAADRLIPPVAETIRRQARAADLLARLGQSRFGVLLVETDEVSAINYVERIRSQCDVWLAAGAVALRLSVGWAEIRADRTVEASVSEAEQRLFDDRRRSEPPDSMLTEAHEGLSAVFQPTGT